MIHPKPNCSCPRCARTAKFMRIVGKLRSRRDQDVLMAMYESYLSMEEVLEQMAAHGQQKKVVQLPRKNQTRRGR